LKESKPEDYDTVKTRIECKGKFLLCLENGLAATIYKPGTDQVTQITKKWHVNLTKRYVYPRHFLHLQQRILNLQSGDYPIIEIQIGREKVYLTFYTTDIEWVMWALTDNLKLAFCVEHLAAYADQAYESLSKTCETLQQAILKKVEPSLIPLLFPKVRERQV
jgi:hypothetical protein